MISVIIPVYNVQNYLRRCIESVTHQTLSDLEIILINDGSTDNSLEICKKYALIDNRIILIDQKNKGLSAARNAGLNIAKGEWIAFLDSDDWVSPDMYEKLLLAAQKFNADISSCDTICFTPNSLEDLSSQTGIKNEIVLTPEEMIEGLYTQNIVRFEVWNKLWKKDLISSTRFVEGQVSEDIFFDRILFLRANKMVHINEGLHHYLINRPGSTLSSFKIGRMCVFDEFKQLMVDVRDKFPSNKMLISSISAIATNFAISMYMEAISGKIDAKIRSLLLDHFYYFYPYVKGTKYERKNVTYLFRLSPLLYYFVLNIKKRLNL